MSDSVCSLSQANTDMPKAQSVTLTNWWLACQMGKEAALLSPLQVLFSSGMGFLWWWHLQSSIERFQYHLDVTHQNRDALCTWNFSPRNYKPRGIVPQRVAHTSLQAETSVWYKDGTHNVSRSPQNQGQATGQATWMEFTPKEYPLKSEQQPYKGEGLCSLIWM